MPPAAGPRDTGRTRVVIDAWYASYAVMILDPIPFDGSIERAGLSVAVTFTAAIDDDGELRLEFGPIKPSHAAASIVPEQPLLTPLQPLTLRGHAAEHWSFESSEFYVGRWSRRPDHVEITGSCGTAELSRPAKPDHHDACAWFFRKLAAIHPIVAKTKAWSIVLRGYRDDADQEPVSLLAVESDRQENEAWWQETERLLIHVQRVLSLACGVYLLPVYEQRHRAGRFTIRIAQRGRSPAPYLAPFRDLFMEEIFAAAVRSFDDHPAEVARLDPAIRWLTAPVALAESRLMNAMSALECILASSDVGQFHLADAAFDTLRQKITKFLKAEAAPRKMAGKLRELNRRSFAEKLRDLLSRQPFPAQDFPDEWLKGAVDARNVIVHTGVSPELPIDDASLIDHVVRVREIVIRLMLAAIGFEGQYQSWLHGCADLRFPSCTPVAEATISPS